MDTAKKTATKATNKTASSSNGRGPSIRQRVFELLNKSPNGVTGAQIKEKLGLSGVPSILKDEGISEKPRIRRSVQEDVRGVLYHLTALGKKDLAAGKVDENAAPASGGKDWPNGR